MISPLSETLILLIGFAEETIARPAKHARYLSGFSEAERFAALASEVRAADARPAEGVRATGAAMIMVFAIEAFFASDREPTSQWLGVAGVTLPLLRAEAWIARRNEQEARGS
jgi:hypothetical protein